MYRYEVRRDGELLTEFEAAGDVSAARRVEREGWGVVECIDSPFDPHGVSVIEVAA